MARHARKHSFCYRIDRFTLTLCTLAATAFTTLAQNDDALVHQNWFEARTAHFNIYSSGPRQEVAKIAARLEQFRDAYGLLAGAQAVVSPPITVIAFPNTDAMQPYLPRYNGKPANIAGFFRRNPDEDIIVLALRGTNNLSLETIYHEYAHLLFRHNQNVWPIWLNEGMAEIYSTFECTGRGVRIGQRIPHHLRTLKRGELMPLAELLRVQHDSPQYNESDRQGMFYAESWLLTHFLMNGDNLAFKNKFSNYTAQLRLGQPPDQALARALGVPLANVESELRRYLERGQFEPLGYVLKSDLSAPRSMTTRPIGYAETAFRLGNELMRIDRLDDAEPYFEEAKKIMPASPLSYEGMGLLYAARDQHETSAQYLTLALDHGSTSFRAHYVYAEQRLLATGDSEGHFHRVESELAAEIQSGLQKSIGLMPDFGPAHQLLGFFELVQGDDYGSAETHLQRAIQLEPERQHYLLYLAEAQMQAHNTDAARRTLEPLTHPYVNAKLRDPAAKLMAEMDRAAAHAH
jgi:tetratricopeptide (TPR) repeat protein